MHETGNLYHLCLIDTECIGVGHHDTRNGVVEQALEIIGINGTVSGRLHLYDLEAAYSRTGRVGAVGAIGHDDAGTPGFATHEVVLAHHHQTGKLAMSASIGCEREIGQSGEFAQRTCRMVIDGEGTLHALFALQGMQPLESSVRSHLLIDLGVVLHGAATQRIEASLYAKVLVRYVGVVAHYIEFAHLGEFSGSLAKQS